MDRISARWVRPRGGEPPGQKGARLVTIAGVAVAIGLVSAARAGGPSSRTKVTVWASPPAATLAYGGLTYGGYAPTTGAMITEQREVELAGTGEVRIEGVAATIDPASVQLRDLTEPTATIGDQRFVAGATTPTQILAERIGDPVTVVTPKGDVSGVLRSIDEQALVIETGTGDQRRLQVMRRDGYVQDVRLPARSGGGKPSLVWRLAAKKPGKHTVEVSYRADGMSWSADYLAVLDDAGKAVDFSAWATIKNATGASYDDAEVTLVSGGNAGPAVANPLGGAQGRAAPVASPLRYMMKAPVHIGAGQSVQVELLPPKLGAKARSVVTYEAMPDPSLGFQTYANTDCNQFNGAGMSAGRAEIAVELDVPTKDPLPDGRVRMFRRRPDRLEVVSEDQLKSSPGLARVRLAPDTEITGERRAITCNLDERAHTVVEKLEIKIENKAKQAAEVVIREFAWRWPVWKLEAEDAKSVRAGAQTLEYRVNVPANGKRTVTYSVVYSAW